MTAPLTLAQAHARWVQAKQHEEALRVHLFEARQSGDNVLALESEYSRARGASDEAEAALLALPSAPQAEHVCHDMNPPFPGPCPACELEGPAGGARKDAIAESEQSTGTSTASAHQQIVDRVMHQIVLQRGSSTRRDFEVARLTIEAIEAAFETEHREGVASAPQTVSTDPIADHQAQAVTARLLERYGEVSLMACFAEIAALSTASAPPQGTDDEFTIEDARDGWRLLNQIAELLGISDGSGEWDRSDLIEAATNAGDFWQRHGPAAPPQGWQPIATAEEGVDVFAFFPDASEEYQRMVVHKLGDEWYQQDVDSCPEPLEVEPTHWMPLPAPPSAPTGEKQ